MRLRVILFAMSECVGLLARQRRPRQCGNHVEADACRSGWARANELVVVGGASCGCARYEGARASRNLSLSLSLSLPSSFARFGAGARKGLLSRSLHIDATSLVLCPQMVDAVPGQPTPAGTFS